LEGLILYTDEILIDEILSRVGEVLVELKGREYNVDLD
jgi:hypothetical protein